MPAPEIPGMYYDKEKKRYFKINSAVTNPYTPENVRRWKTMSKEAKEARRRLKMREGRIRRSDLLSSQPLTGGRLIREFGVVDYELPIRSWAGGLRERGEISFSHGAHGVERQTSPNLPCFYVDGSDHKSGLGVAYATVNAATLYGSYIPTDDNDRINFNAYPQFRRERLFNTAREVILLPQMSSIKYHAASHRIFLTSRDPGSGAAGLAFFSPPLSDFDDPGPAWGLGECDLYQRLSLSGQGQVVNTCTPAPASSNLACLIGTNHGIMRLFNNGELRCLTGRLSRQANDIFSMDFSTNNHQVFFAGGRHDHVWQVDIRTTTKEWDWFRHRSSIAHVKAINEHHVLAAGPKNGMSIYDVRYSSKRHTAALLRFPEYKNEAHLHIGLDVSTSMGVVAAAQDDGTVAVFSLRSGKKVKGAAVNRIQADGVVKVMQFQTMPRESMPSLFAGVGPYLQKFSFGTDGDEWEERPETGK